MIEIKDGVGKVFFTGNTEEANLYYRVIERNRELEHTPLVKINCPLCKGGKIARSLFLTGAIPCPKCKTFGYVFVKKHKVEEVKPGFFPVCLSFARKAARFVLPLFIRR